MAENSDNSDFWDGDDSDKDVDYVPEEKTSRKIIR